MNTYGTVRANLAQVRKRWQIYVDNVQYFEALERGRGTVVTLDVRPYVRYLTDFAIFFTADTGR